jgi:putative membrane protein
MKLILRWIINAIAVWIAAFLIEGITLSGNLLDVFLVGLVMGLVNAIIKPVLKLLALPITIVTLGLFTLVINAGMLALVAWIMPSLSIDSFFSALIGGILISIVSTLLNWFLDN